jgi:ferritin
MDKKLEKVINEQINKELYSSYLYLAMAAHFEAENLKGCAHWMKKQAGEENKHAMKFYEFMNDRGAHVVLEAIDKPASAYASIKEVFKKSLAHEQMITASINNIYSLAKTCGDTAAEVMLHWFITEQIEEEKNVMDILAQLQYIKEDSAAVLFFDKHLGKRE